MRETRKCHAEYALTIVRQRDLRAQSGVGLRLWGTLAVALFALADIAPRHTSDWIAVAEVCSAFLAATFFGVGVCTTVSVRYLQRFEAAACQTQRCAHSLWIRFVLVLTLLIGAALLECGAPYVTAVDGTLHAFRIGAIGALLTGVFGLADAMRFALRLSRLAKQEQLATQDARSSAKAAASPVAPSPVFPIRTVRSDPPTRLEVGERTESRRGRRGSGGGKVSNRPVRFKL